MNICTPFLCYTIFCFLFLFFFLEGVVDLFMRTTTMCLVVALGVENNAQQGATNQNVFVLHFI